MTAPRGDWGDDMRNKPLRVTELIATRKGEAERGPAVFMHVNDARNRLLNEGELAWVYGPRRHELATVIIDERIKEGDVVLRDTIAGSPSEIVRVIKPDLDRRGKSVFV